MNEWGSTEWWVHRDEFFAVAANSSAASRLRKLTRQGRIGIVEYCNEARQRELDSIEDILSNIALTAVQEEVA